MTDERSMPAIFAPQELEFDGERFVPGAAVEITYLHWQRYLFAVQLAQGKRVLDIACGEGYGAAVLASVAAHVDAFDVSEKSIAHARATYGDVPRLDYSVGDLRTFFEKAAGGAYDLITAFEIIEHVGEREQAALLEGIKKALAPGGVALISTPDKRLYTDIRLGRNPFHVRELYRDEFSKMLEGVFRKVRIFEQLACTGAALFETGSGQAALSEMRWTDLVRLKGRVEPGLNATGEYLIAACANELPVALSIVGSVVVDPSKKLIGEELYAKHLEAEAAQKQLEASRLEIQAARRAAQEDAERSQAQILAARSQFEAARLEGEALRQSWCPPEEVERLRILHESITERLVEAIARSGEQVGEGRRAQAECEILRSELDRVGHALHVERLDRAELESMVSLRAIRIAKRYWDRVPRVKRVVKGVLKGLL
jgi:SAM-dependent methyltransferase